MRILIIYAVLLWASAGSSYSTLKNQITRKDLLTTTSTEALNTNPTKEPEFSGSSTELSSITVNAESTSRPIAQDTSELPALIFAPDGPEIQASLSPASDEPPRRRIITYDQRQEGQYNIRADLENFMIVMVPQEPSIFSELFLMKALKHKPSASKEKFKNKNSFNVPNFLKYHESSRRVPNLNYNMRPPLSPHDVSTIGKQTPVAVVDDSVGNVRRLTEFIEGRTPYHVDISASDDEQSRLHPDRQVDVLPPPYPLAYQHLKPYHLEAEPTVIQALPPADLQAAHVSSNFLETYNQLLTSGLKSASAADANSRARHNNDGPELGYYRLSRSIRGGDNALDSDRSNALNSLSPHASSPRITELPLYRSEHSLGAAGLYPPIDVPKEFSYFALRGNDAHRSSEFQETSAERDQVLDEDSSIGRVILPTLDITVPQDDVELELHGVSLLDRAAKTLLSDGMERCAPGHRRDSYGLCREIEGY